MSYKELFIQNIPPTPFRKGSREALEQWGNPKKKKDIPKKKDSPPI